ncbi:MAG: betaine--homocysteine S-methyltransferase, partial [Pseudomonadota bacterium]
EHPDRVKTVHRGFVDAGSDLLLTNSFGANRKRLELHSAQDQVAELNQAAVRLAREAAEGASQPVLIAGAMGPTGEIFSPVGAFLPEEGEAVFAEQAQALAEGGADLLWIETISSVEELTAAVAGAAKTGLPIAATMTFDTRGRTMMGLTCEAAMGLRAGLALRPVAFGANCGVGPAQLIDSVLGLMGAAEPGDILIAKGNCGLPQYHDGEIRYDGTPEVMADYACLARDAGARIIGGCCGTTAGHVAAMAKALADRPAGTIPDRATVERALGPTDAEPATPKPRERQRARRRG